MGWLGTKTDADIQADKKAMEKAKKDLAERAKKVPEESIWNRGGRSDVWKDHPEANKGDLNPPAKKY